MAMIFGLLGRGFGRLGAARAKDKSSGGPTPPAYSPTYFILGF